jgi:hypothetical protein
MPTCRFITPMVSFKLERFPRRSGTVIDEKELSRVAAIKPTQTESNKVEKMNTIVRSGRRKKKSYIDLKTEEEIFKSEKERWKIQRLQNVETLKRNVNM